MEIESGWTTRTYIISAVIGWNFKMLRNPFLLVKPPSFIIYWFHFKYWKKVHVVIFLVSFNQFFSSADLVLAIVECSLLILLLL